VTFGKHTLDKVWWMSGQDATFEDQWIDALNFLDWQMGYVFWWMEND